MFFIKKVLKFVKMLALAEIFYIINFVHKKKEFYYEQRIIITRNF